MKVNVRQGDGSIAIVEIADTSDYPDILFSSGRAFKLDPQTDEYLECSVYVLHQNAVINIDYLTACIALVRASEHLNQLLNPDSTDIRNNALAWRLRCATEAITFIKNRNPQQIEEYLQAHYPSGL